jgi:hypothetical protein
MGSKYLKAIRDRLYEESPHCRNCGTLTVVGTNNEEDTATIQHIKPRFHPDYGKELTLWCYKCNNLDSQHKSKNKIFSRDEMVYFLSGLKNSLKGLYIVDGVAITYDNHKPIKIQPIYMAKLDMMSKYMEHYINSFSGHIRNGKLHRKYTPEPFELYFKKRIKGMFNIEQYSIGNGWYQTPWYQQNLVKIF